MFQLVLQFSPWDSSQLDALVALEDRLIDAIGEAGDVDGHDGGSGEANIFIHTDQPAEVLALCLPLIRATALPQLLGAASRPLSGSEYTRLWPPASSAPFHVA